MNRLFLPTGKCLDVAIDRGMNGSAVIRSDLRKAESWAAFWNTAEEAFHSTPCGTLRVRDRSRRGIQESDATT